MDWNHAHNGSPEHVRSVLLVQNWTDEHEVQAALNEIGLNVCVARTAVAARAQMAVQRFSLVVADDSLPDERGFEFLCSARALHPDTARIMTIVSADATLALAAFARAGVHRLLLRPLEIRDLVTAIRRTFECAQLQRATA